MDDYVFMTLAKLKADRLRLTRERRRAETDPEQLRLELVETVQARPARPRPVRSSVSTRWFSHQLLWREQS